MQGNNWRTGLKLPKSRSHKKISSDSRITGLGLKMALLENLTFKESLLCNLEGFSFELLKYFRNTMGREPLHHNPRMLDFMQSAEKGYCRELGCSKLFPEESLSLRLTGSPGQDSHSR